MAAVAARYFSMYLHVVLKATVPFEGEMFLL